MVILLWGIMEKGISEINEINHTENNRKRKVRRK